MCAKACSVVITRPAAVREAIRQTARHSNFVFVAVVHGAFPFRGATGLILR
jgi:hypothetical protein